MNVRLRRAGGTLLTAAVLLLLPGTRAQTVVTNTWLGGTNLWDTPANWSTGEVPNQIGSPDASYRVILGSGAPTLASDVEVDFLVMDGGGLNGGGFSMEVLQGLSLTGSAPDTFNNIRLTFTGGSWTQGDIALTSGANVVSRGLFELVAANTMTIDATSSWRNEGTLTTTADVLTTIDGAFQNSGTVLVPQGALQVTGDVTQTAGEIELQGISGVLTLASPTAATSSDIIIDGGRFTGTGDVGKNIKVNAGGLLSPGTDGSPFGHITSRGSLTLEAGSRVVVHIGGTVFNPPTQIQYDRFEGGGGLKADGILEVRLLGGFEPDGSDRFLIAVSNGSMDIAFSNVAVGGRLDTLDGGGSFLLFQDNRNLYLQDFIPIPEPGAATLGLLGAAVLFLRRLAVRGA